MDFAYKIKKKTGEIEKGVMNGHDRFALARQFRQQGSIPISITEKRHHGGGDMKNIIEQALSRISLHEKIIFTHNLSGMLSAGLSLNRALSILEKQTKNIKLKTVLNELSGEIDKGGTLSEGMEHFPNVFSQLFVSMVRAGEESGSLTASLNEIGSNLDKAYTLNKKIKGAMTYPAIILSAIILIGILMMIYVVPTLTGTFKEIGVELPTSTRIIIFISDTLSQHPLRTFGVIVAFVVACTALLRAKGLKKYFDYIVLKLPAVGIMIKEVNAARTARTLSSLLLAGVDMTKALSITRDVLQNKYYKDVLDKSIESVQKGVPLSTLFRDRLDLYPIMVGEMMEVGEETGKLSQMLTDIATFYESEVDMKTKSLSTIIEPVLMLVMGGAVGFFAVSMITPLYSVMDTIK